MRGEGWSQAMAEHFVLTYELPNSSQLGLHGNKWVCSWVVWQELLFPTLYVFPLLPEFPIFS